MNRTFAAIVTAATFLTVNPSKADEQGMMNDPRTHSLMSALIYHKECARSLPFPDAWNTLGADVADEYGVSYGRASELIARNAQGAVRAYFDRFGPAGHIALCDSLSRRLSR